MVIQSIHDILASDPLPVAVMVLWDPDFFLAYAQRGKGALHSSLALIGSDLLQHHFCKVWCCVAACYRCHRRNWAWPRKKRSCWKTATLLLRLREVHRSDPAGRCFQPKRPRASLQILSGCIFMNFTICYVSSFVLDSYRLIDDFCFA